MAIITLSGLIVVAALAYVLLRPRPTPEVSGYFQITHDGLAKDGFQQSVAGTPAPLVTDGARLYFTEGTADSQTLAQISVAGGEKANVPTPLGFPQLLDIRPDRSELLVGDFAENPTSACLWLLPVPGGTPRPVGNVRAQDATWSPDGKQIAYVNGKDLFRVDADGMKSELLAHLPGIGWRPRWSPDAKLLRLTVEDTVTTFPSLWELRSDGTNLHRLLPGWNQPPGECCGVWNTDGSQYVFQSSHNGKTEIWALSEKRGMRSFVDRRPSTPVQITSGQMSSISPAFSPDGKTLYVIGQELRGELQHWDRLSMRFVPYLGGISAEMADFSRDGQWVTYVAFPEGTLWRSRLDGSERLQLTSPPARVRVPRWSPDGDKIVFDATVPGQPPTIYTSSAEGGPMEPATPGNSHLITPGWSPDGRSLIFSYAPFFSYASPEASGVLIEDLQSRKVRKVPGSRGLFSSEYSPDGRYVAALSSQNSRAMLFDFQTGSWTELLPRGGGFQRWSRDGRYIYILRTGKDPAILRTRLSDRKVDEVVKLKDIRQAGLLAGVAFTLDPQNSPVILRDVGIQEIYSLAWGAR